MDPMSEIGLGPAGSSDTDTPSDADNATGDVRAPASIDNIGSFGQTPGGMAHGPNPLAHTASMVQSRRDVFWQNVTREVLMAMAAEAAANTGRISATPKGAANSPSPVADLFDGRMGIITTLGQRIPIADVIPVFAVSRPGCPEDRLRSNDVQCTVFRISTPGGESYTLPIHHIAGIHSMSDALANQLESAARAMEGRDDQGNRLPFGFAAYTSLARSESEAAAASGGAVANEARVHPE
ncbi:MAG: hypothetical protein AAGA55_03415 [Planctomycetota bacterium]